MFRINKFRKPFGYACNFEKLKPVIFRKFVSKSNNSYSSSIGKYLAVFGIGVGTFYLINKYKNVSNNQKDKKDDEPMLSLDLNEIYEKTAVIFLSNPELRETLGMPIKVTSSGSESDMIRSINLRREGTNLYSFVAYNVQGSQNSGVVYCKLKMEPKSQKFKTESIILKLDKPDKDRRKEILIKLQVAEKK